MLRIVRIGAPGALHHIIGRGIARKKVFNDDVYRDFFLERLARVVLVSQTQCYAWALNPVWFKNSSVSKEMKIHHDFGKNHDEFRLGPQKTHRRGVVDLE